MSEKMHTQYYDIDMPPNGGLSSQWRLAAVKKPDGNFCVTEQHRTGGLPVERLSLAIFTAGIALPWELIWRDKKVVYKSVTAWEAKRILRDFDSACRQQAERQLGRSFSHESAHITGGYRIKP